MNANNGSEPEFPTIRCTGFGGYRSAMQMFFRPERIRDLTESIVGAKLDSITPRGCGKSYGDAALNSSGLALSMARLNRFLKFDTQTGVLRAEAGATVLDVMRTFAPRGFMLPVTPGFSLITLGGCAAFDVHSKNHWRTGGFGDSILSLRLLLADGSVIDCSRTEHSQLFFATVGGAGLTGIILDLDILLQPVANSLINNESIPFIGIKPLLATFSDVATSATYAVAWLDLLNNSRLKGFVIASASGDKLANENKLEPWGDCKTPPLNLIAPFYNRYSNKLFNAAFTLKHRLQARASVDLRSFLFPWDALSNWNKLYGKDGFVEYQCCIPLEQSESGLNAITAMVIKNRTKFPAYFAAVKRMRNSTGMLSFPIEGYSLLLDFPVSAGLWQYLDELDKLVVAHGGRVYLAKDGRLSADAFAKMYPRLDEWKSIRKSVDPDNRFSSDMARRLKLAE